MKKRTITLANGKTVEQPRSHALLILVLVLAALAVSVHVTGFQLSVLISGGYRFFDILKQMVPPDFSYVGKLLYEQIETVDMGAYEAMEALGATRFHAFLYSVIPQILPGYISNCLFCFEGNVRYAAILGYVGAGGLGLIINEKVGWREYDKVGMILLTLFGAVVVIEFVSHQIRKKLT